MMEILKRGAAWSFELKLPYQTYFSEEQLYKLAWTSEYIIEIYDEGTHLFVQCDMRDGNDYDKIDEIMVDIVPSIEQTLMNMGFRTT